MIKLNTFSELDTFAFGAQKTCKNKESLIPKVLVSLRLFSGNIQQRFPSKPIIKIGILVSLMYIHWTHYYLPKVFGVLSFILNPFFIWLILNENITALGSYRYLLVTFASFDIIYTLVELAVPMSIFGTGAAFAVFVSGGPFYGARLD